MWYVATIEHISLLNNAPQRPYMADLNSSRVIGPVVCIPVTTIGFQAGL